MKKENILSVLKDIKNNGITVNNFSEIEKIIEKLENEIRTDNNKKSGNTDIAKAANNIIKLAKKNHAYMKSIHGSWIDKKGFQYVTDTCHAIRIKKPIELEKTDTDGPNIAQLFEYSNLPERFELPTVPELKSMIAEAKAAAKINNVRGAKIIYSLENGPVFNAEYLLNVIMATGADHLETFEKSKFGKYTSPCYIYTDNCDAVICPINKEPSTKNECAYIK